MSNEPGNKGIILFNFCRDQNTWEPLHNMSTCTKLVQEFERNLARQKARKALEASKMPKNVIKIEELVQNSTPQKYVF